MAGIGEEAVVAVPNFRLTNYGGEVQDRKIVPVDIVRWKDGGSERLCVLTAVVKLLVEDPVADADHVRINDRTGLVNYEESQQANS